jgi:hypothetical protein
MGMPTVSFYVLTATLLAPSLIRLGVTPMAAHMYVIYFGMLSMITPPVAIATYAAANIARVSGWTTGWVSVMVGWSTFFIPFLFVLEPALLPRPLSPFCFHRMRFLARSCWTGLDWEARLRFWRLTTRAAVGYDRSSSPPRSCRRVDIDVTAARLTHDQHSACEGATRHSLIVLTPYAS